MCIHMTESLHCIPEPAPTSLIGYTPITSLKFGKEKKNGESFSTATLLTLRARKFFVRLGVAGWRGGSLSCVLRCVAVSLLLHTGFC